MGSKRNVASNVASSSEEDDSGHETAVVRKSERKKSIREQTFRIHSSEFLTSSNRDDRKKMTTAIAYDVSKTEEEIRHILVTELPQLRGKR